MTVAEAQQYVRDMTTGHHPDATSNHYNDIAKAVNKIYDDIGSCGECTKWLNNELGNYCESSLEDMAEDDYCSRFERKEDV